MQGSLLRFYVHEGQRHHGRLVWEWLLERANELGIRGGSAFRAMAGFGRHHVLHESHFLDRKSTRLNSSHSQISYAVFCLKKKKQRARDPAAPRKTRPTRTT